MRVVERHAAYRLAPAHDVKRRAVALRLDIWPDALSQLVADLLNQTPDQPLGRRIGGSIGRQTGVPDAVGREQARRSTRLSDLGAAGWIRAHGAAEEGKADAQQREEGHGGKPS
jgi:hypothetical protein